MTKLFTNPSYTIAAGQAVSGQVNQARVMRVSGSRIWLTVEGSGSDYWLKPGEEFTLPAKRLVVIEADRGDSKIEFGPFATQAARAESSKVTNKTAMNTCAA